jgi:hypothetical protein
MGIRFFTFLVALFQAAALLMVKAIHCIAFNNKVKTVVKR